MERHKLFHRGDNTGDEPLMAIRFFSLALSESGSPDYRGWANMSKLSPEEKAVCLPPLFFQGPDTGPAAISEQLHRDVVSKNLSWNRSYQCWRYVFWDQSRLLTLGVYEDSRNEVDMSPKNGFEDFDNVDRQTSLRESWKLRREI